MSHTVPVLEALDWVKCSFLRNPTLTVLQKHDCWISSREEKLMGRKKRNIKTAFEMWKKKKTTCHSNFMSLLYKSVLFNIMTVPEQLHQHLHWKEHVRIEIRKVLNKTQIKTSYLNHSFGCRNQGEPTLSIIIIHVCYTASTVGQS